MNIDIYIYTLYIYLQLFDNLCFGWKSHVVSRLVLEEWTEAIDIFHVHIEKYQLESRPLFICINF